MVIDSGYMARVGVFDEWEEVEGSTLREAMEILYRKLQQAHYDGEHNNEFLDIEIARFDIHDLDSPVDPDDFTEKWVMTEHLTECRIFEILD